MTSTTSNACAHGEPSAKPQRPRSPTESSLGDDLQERGHRARVEFVTDAAIAALAPRIGTRAACKASGVPRATWYRRHRISPLSPRAVPVPHSGRVQPRALALAERRAILDALHSGRFADLAPAKSGRRCWTKAPTWDRRPPFTGCCARPAKAVSVARRPPTPPPSSPSWQPPGRTRSTPGTSPSCTARRNGPTTTLYVILDIYSRYAVGWMVATCESAAQSQQTTASDAREVSSWISQSKRLAELTSDGIPAELTQP